MAAGLGAQVAALRCDVSNEADVAALLDETEDRLGPPDIAFANAGIGSFASVVDTDLDEWRRVLDVNLIGPLLTIKHVARRMRAGGSIIATSSLNAVQASKGMSVYCASKAGLAMLVQVAALELGERGIRVNAIGPGLVRTALTDAMWLLPAIVEDFDENAPLDTTTSADDVASLVTFSGLGRVDVDHGHPAADRPGRAHQALPGPPRPLRRDRGPSLGGRSAVRSTLSGPSGSAGSTCGGSLTPLEVVQPGRSSDMPSAAEAREWAAGGGLHGIGDSLYTPFSGADGDDIDWDAYRTLVRYCVGDLRHDMLWLTSGIGEWWSLTMEERKRLLEVAVEEARNVAPATVDAGLHERRVRQGLRRTDAARTGARRGHLLPPDAAHGGACRRGRAAILPLRRRPHRHRARHVQLAVIGLRAHGAGDGGHPP